MRKVVLSSIFITCLLVSTAFGQGKVIAEKLIEPEYITVTIDSITEKTIYYLFPHPRGLASTHRTAPSTTAPTSASVQVADAPMFSSTGDVFISMVLDTLTASDTDSLYAYVKPLVYDNAKKAFYTSASDVFYLVFDTAGTYTASAIDYLSWTHGYCYTASLSGALWPCAGFALTIDRVSGGVANADVKAYVGIWTVR